MAQNKQAKEILKEIKDLEALLKEDLDSWDPRALPGKRAQHAQAKNRIASLMAEYRKYVRGNVAAIYVSGDLVGTANFTKLAAEKGGTITVDGLGIYGVLAESVFDNLRRNQIDYDHVGNLQAQLQLIAATVRYYGSLNVRFTKLLDRPFMHKSDLIDAIRQLCQAELGDMVNVQFIAQEIEDRAFASGISYSPVPCVILNAGEDDKAALQSFLFGESFVEVTVDSSVDEKTVTKAFNDLKKKLKSNTNTTEETNTQG